MQFCRLHYGSIFICLAVVDVSLRNHAKSSENSYRWEFKVIDLGVNRKRMQIPISHW